MQDFKNSYTVFSLQRLIDVIAICDTHCDLRI